jgi:arylsulfatase A-like enzyme
MADFRSRFTTRTVIPLCVPVACLALAANSPATGSSPEKTDSTSVNGAPRHGGAAELRSDYPNIVIFLIDAQRADRLGTYGYTRRPTSPRLDALGQEGVVFEEACSAAPWTLPSVASLMTSTFPCEHQTLNDRDRLGESFDTLTSRLKRLGYTILGLYSNPYAGPKFGVARDYDEMSQSKHNDGPKVAKVLDRHPHTPFFLYVHNGEPHNPYEAPMHTDGFSDVSREIRTRVKDHSWAYRRLTRADFMAKQLLGATDNTSEQDEEIAELNTLWVEYNELYDTAVRQADGYVASVIDLLVDRGLWDNTLFIVLADHGEEMSEHGGWLHDQSAYQELMHVPLIMRFPRGEYGGQRVRPVVSLVDVLPTIFEYLGESDLAEDARGESLLPLIRGEVSDDADEFVVPSIRINTKKYYKPWKESRGDINVVVRRGDWKGIWNVETRVFELYDLGADPWEQEEISARNPEVALAMRVFAKLWYLGNKREAAERLQTVGEPDAETLGQLRSLGYVD